MNTRDTAVDGLAARMHVLETDLAAARQELRLEAAVERVRARAMGMHGTDDLSGVLFTLFDEYMALQLGVLGVGLTFIDESGRLEPWIAAEGADGERTLHKGTFGKDDIALGHVAFDAWKEQSWFCILETPEFIQFIRGVYGLTFDRVLETVESPEQYLFGAMHRYGMLHAVAPRPIEEDEAAATALRRFATAFELAWARYLDIQRAEEAAREARIEAALERIRGQAMAMRESDDLLDVVVTMRSEFVALGHEAHYFWHMRWMPDMYHKAMTSGDGTRIGMVMDLPRGFHNVPAMTAWEQIDEPIGVFQFDADGAIDYVHRMIEQGRFHEIDPHAPTDEDIRHIGGITFVMARTTHGEIGYSLPGEADPPDEATDVLARFAGAFDMAYRRFEDLRQAEEQAREAEIEAALERVRSATSAMHSSEDIGAASVVLFDQLRELGIDSLRCGVGLPQGDGTYEFWAAATDGQGITRRVIGHESIDVHPVIRRAFEGWQRGEPHQSALLEGEDLAGYYAAVFPTMPLPDWKQRMQEGDALVESFSTFPFSDGWVYIFLPREPTPGEVDTVHRFTRVYDQTYRRYKELMEAEARAREADIELGLERIRARAMAMQQSDELSDTIGVLFEQLTTLGVHALNTYLVLYDLEGDAFSVRMTGKDGNTAYAETSASFSDMPQFRSARESWESGDPIIRIHYPPDRVGKWLEHFQQHNKKLPPGARLASHDFPNGVFNTSGRHAHGSLGITADRPATPEEEELLGRFAREFERAYQRFRDLEAAEKAAHEARIEAALERVRSRTMAMHDSDELQEVVSTAFRELTGLGLDIARCIIWVFDPDTDGANVWMADAQHPDALATYRVPYHDNPGYLAVLQAWRAREKDWVYELSGETKRSWDEVLFTKTGFAELPEAVKEHMMAPERVVMTASFAKFGGFQTAGLEPLHADKRAILQRFGTVLDLTYQRFDDLKQAEAQAREARIETALERVRSRALAMQTSDELHDVAVELRAQMNALDQSELEICAIRLYDQPDTFATWVAVREGPGTDATVSYQERLPRVGAPAIEESIALYESDRTEYTVVNEGAGARAFMALLKEHAPDLYEKRYRPLEGVEELPRQTWHCADFSGGSLLIVTEEPPDPESLALLRRSANVFDLAYRRFRDLEKAEEDNRRIIEEKERAERALAELRATQKQLVEQEKLASLGALTAGIAHEIKNPLNFVNNFAEVNAELADELAEAVAKGDADEANAILADLRENATQIAKHGKRADSIVRSMMQHARGGASEREAIDVNVFLEEYAGLAWHGMRARDDRFKAEVVRDFADDAGTIEAMPQELGRVVLNLLNNAFDAVKLTEGARVTIASRRTGDRVEIAVSDNGPGIPPEIREKIFEPFFTTKPTGEGTGLGLSLSYDIATKGHGGTMTVGESPEGGAVFRVTLPI